MIFPSTDYRAQSSKRAGPAETRTPACLPIRSTNGRYLNCVARGDDPRRTQGEALMPSHSDLQQITAVDQCRTALARGPLIRDGNHWRFGRRCFSNMTVKRLIDDGAAIRDRHRVISKLATNHDI